ncbi:MAG: L,D-transpeptidase [Bifidobacteriaceae bacterium]|jgi:lipoprotein-anchoring transpeptidase ErfK/SrfK|nr:L,D-transpeptidase [Bifidobacteriaceae bacterium]
MPPRDVPDDTRDTDEIPPVAAPLAPTQDPPKLRHLLDESVADSRATEEAAAARRRRLLPVLLGLLVGLGAWIPVGWMAIMAAQVPEPEPATTVVASVAAAVQGPAAKAAAPAAEPDGPYRIAHLPGDVTAYTGPGGEAAGTVAGSWWSYPSKLPIVEERDGYLRVRLQQRPNEATAWISAEGVEITETPYRILIDLDTRRVKLLELGVVVTDVPAIIGAPETPTPTGHFFVTMLQPGGPGYGKLVLVLSAHSEVISDWQNSGDAVSAIHGPLGDEASVDKGGATTNGCIRIHMADLDFLAETVPPGAPVDIVEGV